jgi:methylated-DNA-[protein]-cysteine S-methyltransferase
MEPIIYRGEILTPAGTMRVAATDRGACALILPGVAEPKERVARLLALARLGPAEHPILEPLLAACSRYFAGKPEALEGQPVDWSLLTPFQRQVYQAARTIPPGEVRPYGWVAQRMSKPSAARAVGRALAMNPVPLLIPCHRVVAADGSLRGFTAGIAWKQKLLEMERLR